MGRKAGRTVSAQTAQEIVSAVAADFANQAMERSARQRLKERLADIPAAGQFSRLVVAGDGQVSVERYGPVVAEPRVERSDAHQRKVEADVICLDALLSRPRQQPPKFPALDA